MDADQLVDTRLKIGVGYTINNLLSFGPSNFIGIMVLLCLPPNTTIKCSEVSRLKKVV